MSTVSSYASGNLFGKIYRYKIIDNYYSKSEIHKSILRDFINVIEKYYENNDFSVLEVLSNYGYQKAYFDIDGINNKKYKFSDICDQVKKINKIFIDYSCDKFNLDINRELLYNRVVMTINDKSNTHPGVGFHVIFPIITFSTNPRCLESYIKEFVLYLKSENDKITDQKEKKINFEVLKHIDTSIYTLNRLFRVIGANAPGVIKKGEIIPRNNESRHIPFGLDDDLNFNVYSSYIIQNTDIKGLDSKDVIIKLINYSIPIIRKYKEIFKFSKFSQSGKGENRKINIKFLKPKPEIKLNPKPLTPQIKKLILESDDGKLYINPDLNLNSNLKLIKTPDVSDDESEEEKKPINEKSKLISDFKCIITTLNKECLDFEIKHLNLDFIPKWVDEHILPSDKLNKFLLVNLLKSIVSNNELKYYDFLCFLEYNINNIEFNKPELLFNNFGILLIDKFKQLIKNNIIDLEVLGFEDLAQLYKIIVNYDDEIGNLKKNEIITVIRIIYKYKEFPNFINN